MHNFLHPESWHSPALTIAALSYLTLAAGAPHQQPRHHHLDLQSHRGLGGQPAACHGGGSDGHHAPSRHLHPSPLPGRLAGAPGVGCRGCSRCQPPPIVAHRPGAGGDLEAGGALARAGHSLPLPRVHAPVCRFETRALLTGWWPKRSCSLGWQRSWQGARGFRRAYDRLATRPRGRHMWVGRPHT